nr:hypothetical protein Iba_chr03aCG15210 [Ipomoea batatas]GMC76787.1 hypothetical protein Iba_chr03eCG4500 [Ipomoea batatas]GME13019.1 hypothetical protein Iba_scaffold14336CG0030 [Ipomoea batatas]
MPACKSSPLRPRSSDTFLPLMNITNKMPRIRRPKATAPATIPTNSPTAMFFSSSILGGVKLGSTDIAAISGP